MENESKLITEHVLPELRAINQRIDRMNQRMDDVVMECADLKRGIKGHSRIVGGAAGSAGAGLTGLVLWVLSLFNQ